MYLHSTNPLTCPTVKAMPEYTPCSRRLTIPPLPIYLSTIRHPPPPPPAAVKSAQKPLTLARSPPLRLFRRPPLRRSQCFHCPRASHEVKVASELGGGRRREGGRRRRRTRQTKGHLFLSGFPMMSSFGRSAGWPGQRAPLRFVTYRDETYLT